MTVIDFEALFWPNYISKVPALDIKLTFWYWSFICKIFIQPWKKLSYSIEIPKLIKCYQNNKILTDKILPNLVFFDFFVFCLFTFLTVLITHRVIRVLVKKYVYSLDFLNIFRSIFTVVPNDILSNSVFFRAEIFCPTVNFWA